MPAFQYHRTALLHILDSVLANTRIRAAINNAG
jgi:hypothetical protein